MLVVVIVDYRGEQKASFEKHLFPFWERTENFLRDTNEFNIDSLMETKKFLLCFELLMSFTVGSYRQREGERSTATVLRALSKYHRL